MYAAFLTAVSPFQVLAAQEARMYAMLAFLTVLSWAALLAALEARWEGWVVYIAASSLALYTHYFAFLNLLGQAVFVLGMGTPLWRRWAVSQFVILGMYLPWLGRFLTTVTSGQGWPFLRPPLEVTSLTALLGLLSFGGHAVGFPGWFGGGSASPILQTAILAPFVALAALGFVAVWGQPRARWFVVGSFIVPLGAVLTFSLRTNVIYPRYFSFLHVPFALALTFGVFRIASYVVQTRPQVATFALGLLLLLVSVPVLRGVYLDPRFQVYNWRDAAMWLTTEAGPSDLIIVTPGFGRVPFSRYFRGPQPIIGIDPVELSDPKTASAQPRQAMEARTRALFQSYAASHEVMWIVTDGGLPQGALVRLATLLEGIYDPQGFAAFNAIRVYKAKRHVEKVFPVSQEGMQLAGSAWHRVVTLC
jgi:hypothetical protein